VAELDDGQKSNCWTVQINRLRDWCRDGLLCIGRFCARESPQGRRHQLAYSGRRRDRQLLLGNCEPVRFPWTICAKCRRVANADPAHSSNAGFIHRRVVPVKLRIAKTRCDRVSSSQIVSSFADKFPPGSLESDRGRSIFTARALNEKYSRMNLNGRPISRPPFGFDTGDQLLSFGWLGSVYLSESSLVSERSFVRFGDRSTNLQTEVRNITSLDCYEPNDNYSTTQMASLRSITTSCCVMKF